MFKRFLAFAPIIIAISVALFSCGDKGARGKVDSERQASVQFDSTIANLGVFPKSSSTRKAVFTFENVGDANLEFLEMALSCNCVSAVLPEKPIKPGKKGEVVVTYKGVNKKPGRVYYKVYLKVSGDPTYVTLIVKGQMTEN